ncbi:MAG TPA: SAM-dependent methyltransferase [Terriglobales bacterium]|nr:SAM-dependent methyltransferase [Terriglobales bacterium]
MRLRQIIEDEIRRQGPISFSRYMELCLYHPEHGYYSRHAGQFGKAGDFYTSSDVHAVFGRLLARQFEQMWRVLDRPPRLEVVELGPGRGLFARDVLDWSQKKFPEFFGAARYVLVESSPALRGALRERLKDQIEAGKASVVESFDSPGDVASNVSTIVFANEFFDALPVDVVDHRGELRVDSRDGRFVETFAAPAPGLLESLGRYSVRPEEHERVEVSPSAIRWMERIAARLQRGFAVLIDYGYSRAEQMAGRHRGTVMAYRQHTASDDPYAAPGEQDITTHVNFTALQAAGEAAGLEPLGFLTQSQFLIGIGEENQFADAFEDCRMPQEQAKVALQLKHLVTPAGMGETFRVLVMARGVEKEKAARLSGLSFAR